MQAVLEADGSVAAEKIRQEQGTKIEQLIREARRLANGKGNPFQRFDMLIDVADNLSRTITPYTPCKSGCSHCCYMAVAISDIEAGMISRYTGRQPAVKGTVLEFLQQSDARIEELTGARCTFLSPEGKCSIYPVRPIACRTHHNLAVDSENCRIKDVEVKMTTPVINLMLVQHAAVDIAMQQCGVGFADIRDYFPPEAE